MLNCHMVRFLTGHCWLCSWPVKKASPLSRHVSVQMVDNLSTVCEQSIANDLHFHVFLVQVASIQRVSFLLCWRLTVNRPTVLNCKASSLLRTVNEQKSKMLIFCMVLIFAFILTIGISLICGIGDEKAHLKRVLHAWEVQISYF